MRFNPEELANAGGWDALNLPEFMPGLNMTPQELQERLGFASHYLATFSNSEQGRWVLNDLVTQYLVQARIVEPHSTQFEAGIRQGQADVVRRILHLIHLSKTGGASLR